MHPRLTFVLKVAYSITFILHAHQPPFTLGGAVPTSHKAAKLVTAVRVTTRCFEGYLGTCAAVFVATKTCYFSHEVRPSPNPYRWHQNWYLSQTIGFSEPTTKWFLCINLAEHTHIVERGIENSP